MSQYTELFILTDLHSLQSDSEFMGSACFNSIRESQSHRMADAGRDLWRPS